jgi:hypothetical protein
MVALSSTVEVLVISAIKIIKSVENVLRSVAMHDIEKNYNTHAMSSVNQLLEVLRRSVSTACSKEAVDLIAKASIVSMLHDSHELDHVVVKGLDSRKHILGELLVGSDTLFRCGDSNVGFINAGTGGLLRSRVLELISFGCRGAPEASIVHRGDGKILSHILYPSRDSVGSFSIRQD